MKGLCVLLAVGTAALPEHKPGSVLLHQMQPLTTGDRGDLAAASFAKSVNLRWAATHGYDYAVVGCWKEKYGGLENDACKLVGNLDSMVGTNAEHQYVLSMDAEVLVNVAWDIRKVQGLAVQKGRKKGAQLSAILKSTSGADAHGASDPALILSKAPEGEAGVSSKIALWNTRHKHARAVWTQWSKGVQKQRELGKPRASWLHSALQEMLGSQALPKGSVQVLPADLMCTSAKGMSAYNSFSLTLSSQCALSKTCLKGLMEAVSGQLRSGVPWQSQPASKDMLVQTRCRETTGRMRLENVELWQCALPLSAYSPESSALVPTPGAVADRVELKNENGDKVVAVPAGAGLLRFRVAGEWHYPVSRFTLLSPKSLPQVLEFAESGQSVPLHKTVDEQGLEPLRCLADSVGVRHNMKPSTPTQCKYTSSDVCVLMVDDRKLKLPGKHRHGNSDFMPLDVIPRDDYITMIWAINRQYARNMGYRFLRTMCIKRLNMGRPPTWCKINTLLRAMKIQQSCGIFAFIDSDAYFGEHFRIENLLRGDRLFAASGESVGYNLLATRNNGGFWVLKNTPETLAMVQEWWDSVEKYPEFKEFKHNVAHEQQMFQDAVLPMCKGRCEVMPAAMYNTPNGTRVRHNWSKKGEYWWADMTRTLRHFAGGDSLRKPNKFRV